MKRLGSGLIAIGPRQSPAAINNTKWIGVLGFLGRDVLIRRDSAPRAVGEVRVTLRSISLCEIEGS
jgi:hypothetical protein